MITEFNIRPLVYSDMSQAWVICQWVFPLWFDSQEAFVEQVRKGFGIAADVDGELEGFAWYGYSEDRITIRGIMVCPDMQNQGLGTAMICKLKQKMLGDCGREPRKRLRTVCKESDFKWHRFLKRNGFTIVRMEPPATIPGDCSYIMDFVHDPPVMTLANRLDRLKTIGI